MAEYKDILELKEFRTLEIDLENGVMKINGDDIKRCTEINVYINPKKEEVSIRIGTEVVFVTQTEKNRRQVRAVRRLRFKKE